MMIRGVRMRVAMVTALLLFARDNSAESLSGRMNVTATVMPNCRLTVPGLSFGAYDPLVTNADRPSDASATIIVTCTRNIDMAVSFDFGIHSSGSLERAMGGASSDSLRYDIFRDPARSLVWTTGSNAARLASHGINTPEQLTVFGRIPPRQEVAPGTYTDLLTAMVDF